ncbi:MAG: YggS family pyridoxal phosphate-dependent enzyme [Thermoleophilia bacterium]|nr:YggS family pyridoxal phosphate-dependent enzyme [Thermoleophilia bacterium]
MRGVSALDPDRLRAAIAETRERLDEAAVRGGRTPGAVELLVAGKYLPADEVPALLAAGVTRLGENRLQDLLAKRAAAGGALSFDFIGHLQRRKVREVLPAVRLIHSVDSAALAAEIAKRAEGDIRVLVEVNIDEEPTKAGITPARLRAFVDEISEHPNLVIGGLMVMPAPAAAPGDSRAAFARARELSAALAAEWRGRHDMRDLSMGTSQDHVVAAEEGATIVRVGRGLIERGRA